MPPSLVRNTLLSRPFIERIGGLPKHERACAALFEIVTQFQQMKAFASEIHTELHLVKPMLKTLGLAFESKPKFFEEQIKGADFALFRSEGDRIKASPLWGTRPYYESVLGLLMVKRYGRNLEEGISGFYLEFESRIPLFQSLYLTKTSAVPWSILTNGKSWVLIRKPLAYEKSVVEIDLEAAVAANDEETLHLFYHTFSAQGLDETLPGLIEEERSALIPFLRERRASLAQSLPAGSARAEVNSVAVPAYKEIFPESDLRSIDGGAYEGGLPAEDNGAGKRLPVKDFDQSDVLTYLFVKGLEGDTPDFEKIILEDIRENRTKETLLSLKILDMTPGFGSLATRLTETIAYLSIQLPYREKHSFVAEWENNLLLHRYVVEHVLFGVERGAFPLEASQNALRLRFDCLPTNYRLGNPLLGMSIKELYGLADDKSQTGLFSRNPREVMTELTDMSRLYFSLSDRIKEDAVVKAELEGSLRVHRQRVKEVMDLHTASYFDASLESRKIKELLYNMDADEALWESARSAVWFLKAKEIALRNCFFHMEIEFPFLLNDRFDLIFVQPAMYYLWEERLPVVEASKAYIKRAMAFLAEKGRILVVGGYQEEVVSDLKKSKRYGVEAKDGVVTVRRR
jgi:hypothetical protein